MLKTGQYILAVILFIACLENAFPQTEYNPEFKFSLSSHHKTKQLLYNKNRASNSTLPISIGVLSVIYLLNPILEYKDKKLYLGITKEISVGWGKLGEHRTAFEYSMIFSGNVRHNLRFSYKYDFLLKQGIEPSHMLQGTAVFSAGAGYFTDFDSQGVFPELSYGYSIRNHKLLFFPHIKFRHTFMLEKGKPGITDLSFGIILGIANPFIDVNIRRKY